MGGYGIVKNKTKPVVLYFRTHLSAGGKSKHRPAGTNVIEEFGRKTVGEIIVFKKTQEIRFIEFLFQLLFGFIGYEIDKRKTILRCKFMHLGVSATNETQHEWSRTAVARTGQRT